MDSFQVTREDIEFVFERHGVQPTEELVEWVLEDRDKIQTALSRFDREQDKAVLSLVEDVLFDLKLVDGDKRFKLPSC